jgi:hypothetical protein
MELFLGEELRGVIGYEELYAVTSFGRVWSYPKKGRKGEWSDLNNSKTRYIRVGLTRDNKRKWFGLHTLVAKAFIANPWKKKQVNHKDGKRYNCRVNNLEWMTARENIQHATDTGLNPYLKLSYSQKMEICRYRSGGTSVKNLSIMYGINVNNIYKNLRSYMPEYIAQLELDIAV